MGVRLPNAYQEVEYIQSSGTQYIKLTTITNVSSTDEWMLDASLITKGLAFGFSDSNHWYSLNTENVNKNNKPELAWGVGGNSALGDSVLNTNQRYLFELKNVNSKLRFILDGVVKGNEITAANYTTSYKFGLFCRMGESSPQYYSSLKLFAFKYWRSGNLLCDLIPCYRKSDDKTGMYDLVSGTFFANAGTGEFLVGPDVIDSISPWLMGRRRLLMQTAEHWTYVLTQKYSAGSAKLKPKLVQITEGQTVVIAWGGCSSFGFTPRVWALKDGAKFNETNSDDLATKYLSADGERTYTVKISGGLVLAGLNTTGTVSAYLYQGDYVKARIT